MRVAIWIVIAFGLIIFGGGVIGYVTKHSLASLIAGSLFGIALLSSAYALSQGIYKGHYIALILAILLTVFFHVRFVQCQQFMPSGLLSILGCLVSVSLLILRPNNR